MRPVEYKRREEKYEKSKRVKFLKEKLLSRGNFFLRALATLYFQIHTKECNQYYIENVHICVCIYISKIKKYFPKYFRCHTDKMKKINK